MRRIKKDWRFILLYALLLLAAFTILYQFGRTAAEKRQVVGFITPGSITEDSWQKSAYEALALDCQEMGMDLLVRPEVPASAGECLSAVEDLAAEGAEMIVLNSMDYSAEVKDALSAYPGIAFYGLNFDYEEENLISYSVRMYQVRYLSGILAGLQTKTDQVGIVAPARTYEVYRGVNAFALGVQRVNPDARVNVVWAEDGGDGSQAAKRLIDGAGADVITCWQSQPGAITAAEEAQVQSIGYYETRVDVSDKYLSSAVCDWEALYRILIQEFQQGLSGDGVSEWLGLEDGALYLTDYSPLVTEEAKAEVEKAKEEIVAGRNVFSGEIHDSDGILQCGEGESMSDDALKWQMDWFIEGVNEYVDET